MGRTRPAARGGGVRALNAHCAANAHVLSDASDGEGGDGDEPPAARRRLAPVGLRPLAWLLARRRPRGHLPAPVLSCKHGHWRLLAAAFQSAPSRPARFVTSLTTPPRAIWPHERAPGRACVRLFPNRRRQGAPRFYCYRSIGTSEHPVGSKEALLASWHLSHVSSSPLPVAALL